MKTVCHSPAERTTHPQRNPFADVTQTALSAVSPTASRRECGNGTKRRECKGYFLPPARPRRLATCDTAQARQPALRIGRVARWLLSTPRACPAPLIRAGAQTCLHRVGPDIPPHPRVLLNPPNPQTRSYRSC